MTVDHYNTLGVLASASASDLRTAYLKLARANHPDKFDGPERTHAEARMQQINEAWNVLGVAHKRREYDAKRPKASGSHTSKAHGGGEARRGRTHFAPFDDDPIARADVDLDPRPIPGSRGVPRWVTFMPIALVVFGVMALGFATMVDASGVFAMGIVAVAFGGVCFLMLPLVVMSRAERDPDL